MHTSHSPWRRCRRLVLALVVSQMMVMAVADAQADDSFSADVPRFVEEAAAAGIDHRYGGPWEYFVGGGVASFDCNADRRPDLLIAGGANESALYVNRSRVGEALAFEHVDVKAATIKGVLGAYPLDIDNDGYQDVVLLRLGENRVLRGGPDCTFSVANAEWGIDGGRAWTTAFAATFEAGNHYPTLAFGNYVDRTAPGSPWGTCHDNVLLRPVGEGGQKVQYAAPYALTPGYCALSLLFTDWNRSGVDDLRISNDRHYYRGGQEQLWKLDGGRYPRRYGTADGWAPLVIWGMGIAETDLNADGFPEYALTSMGDTKLQSLDVSAAVEENRPSYEDIAWDRGATAHRPYTGGDLKPSTGWHAAFADLNNDAVLDLFVAKGNVERMPDFAAFDPDNLLLGSQDGRFHERGDVAGIALDRRGRGAVVEDFNSDGLLDLIVVNREAPVSVFRNLGMQRSDRIDDAPPDSPLDATPTAGSPAAADSDVRHADQIPGPGGNWLRIELEQAGDNRDAIGARLSVRTGLHVQTRRLQVGGGHASGKSGFAHIGLGVAERATVRVQWPDGEWSAPHRVFANHHAIITRGREQVDYWYPVDAPLTTTVSKPPAEDAS